MDQSIKDRLRRRAERGEQGLFRSILRWRYRREGRKEPRPRELEGKAERARETTHRVITERGRNVVGEFKKAYRKRGEGDDR